MRFGKKTIIILILVFIASCVGGFFYANIRRDKALYDDTKYDRSSLTDNFAVYEGNDYSFTFTCEMNRLRGIKGVFACPGETNGYLYYSISSTSGEVLGEGRVKISSLKSGRFTFLGFKEIKESAGKDFTITLSCDHSEDNPVMVKFVPDSSVPGFCYTYLEWSLTNMIMFVFCIAFLTVFVFVLIKIFRK